MNLSIKLPLQTKVIATPSADFRRILTQAGFAVRLAKYERPVPLFALLEDISAAPPTHEGAMFDGEITLLLDEHSEIKEWTPAITVPQIRQYLAAEQGMAQHLTTLQLS